MTELATRTPRPAAGSLQHTAYNLHLTIHTTCTLSQIGIFWNEKGAAYKLLKATCFSKPYTLLIGLVAYRQLPKSNRRLQQSQRLNDPQGLDGGV